MMGPTDKGHRRKRQRRPPRKPSRPSVTPRTMPGWNTAVQEPRIPRPVTRRPTHAPTRGVTKGNMAPTALPPGGETDAPVMGKTEILIIGGSIGIGVSLLIIVMAAVGCWLFWRRRRLKASKKHAAAPVSHNIYQDPTTGHMQSPPLPQENPTYMSRDKNKKKGGKSKSRGEPLPPTPPRSRKIESEYGKQNGNVTINNDGNSHYYTQLTEGSVAHQYDNLEKPAGAHEDLRNGPAGGAQSRNDAAANPRPGQLVSNTGSHLNHIEQRAKKTVTFKSNLDHIIEEDSISTEQPSGDALVPVAATSTNGAPYYVEPDGPGVPPNGTYANHIRSNHGSSKERYNRDITGRPYLEIIP